MEKRGELYLGTVSSQHERPLTVQSALPVKWQHQEGERSRNQEKHSTSIFERAKLVQ